MNRHGFCSVWLRWVAFLGLLVPLVLAGCSSGEEDKKADSGGKADQQKAAEDSESSEAATIVLTSTAFAEGQPVPPRHTADGEDLSPPLSWSAVPEGTKELALICDDPDAPVGTWVHWVIYGIPADAKGLPEGVARDERPAQPAGAVQGKNSWSDGENIGYRGPDPPKGGPHRYFFKLYALDVALPDEGAKTKEELLEAMTGHVIGEGQLMGMYQR